MCKQAAASTHNTRQRRAPRLQGMVTATWGCQHDACTAQQKREVHRTHTPRRKQQKLMRAENTAQSRPIPHLGSSTHARAPCRAPAASRLAACSAADAVGAWQRRGCSLGLMTTDGMRACSPQAQQLMVCAVLRPRRPNHTTWQTNNKPAHGQGCPTRPPRRPASAPPRHTHVSHAPTPHHAAAGALGCCAAAAAPCAASLSLSPQVKC